MNKVILMGRLTADPEIRSTTDGKAVGGFTLAVDRRVAKGEGQKADFIRCVVWEKKAEFTEKYLRKGTKVVLTGRIQTGSYEKDGKKVYTTDVVAEDIEFAESKNAEQKQDMPSQKPSQGLSQGPNRELNDDFMHIPDDFQEELPFN